MSSAESDPPIPTRDDRKPFAFAPLLLGLANAAGPGLALWMWTREDTGAWLLDNALPAQEGRLAGLAWAAASALAYALLCVWVWRRQAEGEARGSALRELGRLLAPLGASMLLPLLHVPELPSERRLLTVISILAVAASLGVSLYTAWPRARTWLEGRARLRELLAAPRTSAVALALLCLAGAVRLSQLGILRHRALGSRIFDLGIFDNLMFHAAAGRWQVTSVLKGGTFTSAHCAPILQLLAPIYALAPGPETLVVLQNVWLASGAVPVYLLARALLEEHELAGRGWIALAGALAWLCHPSLHGVALFDFHALTLAAPMIPWAAYALVRGNRGLWIAAIAGLLLTREDLPFVVLSLCVFAWAYGRRRWALLTALAALATLAIVKLALMEHAGLFMPDTDTSYRYANRFQGVIPDPETGGARDIVTTLLGNPIFVLQHAIVPSKMIYLSLLALPTIGLALLGREGLWAASFGLLFTAIGSGSNLHNPYLHYTVFVFPGLAVAACFGLRRLGERVASEQRERVLVCVALTMAAAACLAGGRFGALNNSRAFRAGQSTLIRGLDDEARARYEWVVDAVAQIPPDASVAASNALGPHVSRRAEFYNYRHRKQADWLLLSMQGMKAKARRKLRVREREGELERVSQWGPKGKELVLLRTVAPPEPE